MKRFALSICLIALSGCMLIRQANERVAEPDDVSKMVAGIQEAAEAQRLIKPLNQKIKSLAIGYSVGPDSASDIGTAVLSETILDIDDIVIAFGITLQSKFSPNTYDGREAIRQSCDKLEKELRESSYRKAVQIVVEKRAELASMKRGSE